MKLTHVGISNFRSIGKEPVMIDLTKKINVLVGANNCGKSNVLRALCSFGRKTEDELDMHLRSKGSYPVCWITDGREIENYLGSDAIAAAYAMENEEKSGFRLGPFQDLESALKNSAEKRNQRAHYYDHAKPKMARLIAPHVARESLGSDLVAWIEKIARVIRHEPLGATAATGTSPAK